MDQRLFKKMIILYIYPMGTQLERGHPGQLPPLSIIFVPFAPGPPPLDF